MKLNDNMFNYIDNNDKSIFQRYSTALWLCIAVLFVWIFFVVHMIAFRSNSSAEMIPKIIQTDVNECT